MFAYTTIPAFIHETSLVIEFCHKRGDTTHHFGSRQPPVNKKSTFACCNIQTLKESLEVRLPFPLKCFLVASNDKTDFDVKKVMLFKVFCQFRLTVYSALHFLQYTHCTSDTIAISQKVLSLNWPIGWVKIRLKKNPWKFYKNHRKVSGI